MTIDQRDYTRARDRARIGAATYSPKQFRRNGQSGQRHAGPPESSRRRATWYVFAFLSGAYSMRWLIIHGFWRW